MLIVVHKRMWGSELELPDGLPSDCEITDDRRRIDKADAVVFHVPELRFYHRPRKRPGQVWVAWSIESSANYPKLADPSFMRRFDLTMTYRRDSDVLWGYVPYYASAANLARALRSEPKPKTSRAPVAMFISAGRDRSGRLDYARELARHIEIDSYGSFMNNATLASDAWRPTKLATIASYPFTIAFENSIDEDYVTEKFYDALVVGSVPLYLGAPNIDAFAPGDRCFVNVKDHASPLDLARYLHSLLADPRAYDDLLAWRRHPFRTAFTEFLDGQQEHPWIRLYDAVRRLRETRVNQRSR